jgi:hypothetical protein
MGEELALPLELSENNSENAGAVVCAAARS